MARPVGPLRRCRLAAAQPGAWYIQWEGRQPFPTSNAAYVRSLNQTPLITWESWDWTGDANQPAYALSNILATNFDACITQ
ncbi:hypothetical protein AB0K43_12990 [Kitasatospora sp. NPDC049258]|uniref:hypothetical protein n=1 Tax=Kitasatospora sp. NPDC049258 TaxID=3155394 RepID=UPI00344082C9